MHLKPGFYILLASLLLTGLTSCLNGEDEIEYIVSTDAQVISFAIKHDSIPSLALAKFSIDQEKEEIYNYDSLPYLTDISEKILVNYTTGSGLAIQSEFKYIGGDTVMAASGDSLNLTNLASLTIMAPNQTTKKTYTVKINIHQIDPDSVQYQLLTNQFPEENSKTVRLGDMYYTFDKSNFFTSPDMEHWERKSLSVPDDLVIESIQSLENLAYAYTTTGEIYSFSIGGNSWTPITVVYEYPVVSVLGYLKSGGVQQEGLALIVNKDNQQTFAFLPDAFSTTAIPKIFRYGENVLANFPVSGFSTINNKSLVLEKITLVGGKNQSGEILNTVWATEDGMHWADLSSNPVGNLPLIEGGNAFAYNNELWFTGGKYTTSEEGTEGNYNKEVFYSVDGGLVWKAKETKAQVPAEFSLRQDASLIIDQEGKYFYIAGGLNQTDIWKAVLNSKLFAH
ncbi:hypothetical protein FACS189474_1450 [Bacteroidia bacterium]|nr:hypothetical protein FACS189474_1450 [Bacteroidia bacterium]